ncbi:ORF6N domain-containing protein [Acinetobacter johnsonii]|uniref:ORF6N domain-containing protein n=1 Tax=Acinetobacter johnsonii TaxID=40214 RepID=A0A3R9ED82_ACIJO|nr:ORF6N domain-containing protein [Acinetobacter johnsonii]RSE17252.1 ORF6N domain-containing protein [Acinetobacter johnsonii]
MSTQISAAKNQVIRFKNVPVVTTAQLAVYFDTAPVRIRQNHDRNKDRFVEGKHYYKITGDELKKFKNALSSSKILSQNASSLILWTERGAARHAKMLDTDHAWDVFERLEDCYFNQEQKVPVKNEVKPYAPTGNDLYLPKTEGRYFVENQKDGTLVVRRADQYTLIRRAHLDVVKKDCKTIIQELELFSKSLEKLESSLELDVELMPILGKLNWRGV